MKKSTAEVPIFEGIYEKQEDAITKGSGFASDRWMKRITGQLLEYRNEIKSHQLPVPPRFSDLPMLVTTVDAKIIIDWGGSSGWTFDFIKQSLPQIEIEEYIIVEIEDVLRYMQEACLHDAPVTYQTEINNLSNKRSSIFYVNSVLQYILDDSAMLNAIGQLNPDWILIEDFWGGDFEDFFSIQNYYESKIPIRFRNRQDFIKSLEKYSLKLSKPYFSSILGRIQELPMQNFPHDKQVRYGETLLFQKKHKV